MLYFPWRHEDIDVDVGADKITDHYLEREKVINLNKKELAILSL